MNLIQRLLLALLVLASLTGAAWAGNKLGGMYWSSATSANGVFVQRLEDQTHDVLCYVAQNSSGMNVYQSPAISCVKVHP